MNVMTENFSQTTNAPHSHDLNALESLAQRLDQTRYYNDAITELLGLAATEAITREQIVPGKIRVEHILRDQQSTAEEQALAYLIGFFMLGRQCTETELNQALGEDALPLLKTLNLVEESTPQQYRALFDLRPHGADDGTELWVSSDVRAYQRSGALRKDHVLGIGQASLTLAQITERTPIKRALDLGTGCGIQTFHLLSHAEHVTATDISERALAFTRFNILLNAKELNVDRHNLHNRVSLYKGSLTEPVQGQKFDLVVSNPPFVITPRTAEEKPEDQFTYRDGGLAGDQLVQTLLNELPAILAPNGRAQMLANWEIWEDSQQWDSRVRQWVNNELDVWCIQRETLSPEQYAETWLKDASEQRDLQHYEQAYKNYLLDFAQRQVTAIGLGMLWLRKPAPSTPTHQPLQRYEEITYPIQQPLAPFITEAIELYDQLNQLTSEELLHAHLEVAQDVTEERHARPGAEHPGVILLREGAGLRRTILESTELAGFVSACDGELSVQQILGALAVLLEWEDGTPREKLIQHIRELIEKGFLRFTSAD